MEIIIKDIVYHNLNINKSIDNDTCFFDIETTGLNRNNDIIYLIGVLYFNITKNSWQLKQFFASGLKDEVKVLKTAVEFLNSFTTIVNYNGDRFDIPFVNHRLKLLNIDLRICKDKSLDIYSILQQNKIFLDIENLKLKSVERYLGIIREDIYTGRDCIRFYKNYILHNNEISKEKILKHNYDDLYYLLEVLNILNLLEEIKTIEIKDSDKSFLFIIETLEIINEFLIVKGIVKGNDYNNMYFYGENYQAIVNNNNEIKLSFEVRKGLISPTEEALYINKENFGIKKTIGNNYNYKIPEHIALITIGNKYLIDNIKDLLSDLIEKTILS